MQQRRVSYSNAGLENKMREIRSQTATEAALLKLITDVRDHYANERPLVVGIHTGGAWVAARLCEALHWDPPATLDISLYRDDFETSGLKRSGTTDRMPQQLNGERILLIDDVLFTGRTIRAAINVLFDYGRPGGIDLGILFDRGGRELPTEPTFLGESLGEEGVGRCKLCGPEPLVLMTPDSE